MEKRIVIGDWVMNVPEEFLNEEIGTPTDEKLKVYNEVKDKLKPNQFIKDFMNDGNGNYTVVVEEIIYRKNRYEEIKIGEKTVNVKIEFNIIEDKTLSEGLKAIDEGIARFEIKFNESMDEKAYYSLLGKLKDNQKIKSFKRNERGGYDALIEENFDGDNIEIKIEFDGDPFGEN